MIIFSPAQKVCQNTVSLKLSAQLMNPGIRITTVHEPTPLAGRRRDVTYVSVFSGSRHKRSGQGEQVATAVGRQQIGMENSNEPFTIGR